MNFSLNSEEALSNSFVDTKDVVHGDLKPENILVFTDDENQTTIKLTDFGYSSFGHTNESIVYPSHSEVWSAPECHDRGMKLQAAKENDVYALGLIAIYVLFMECTGEDGLGQEVMENAVWDFYLQQETAERATEWIGLMKSTGRLLDRTITIIPDKISNEDHRVALQDFFRSSLSVHPQQREPTIDVLIDQLEGARYEATRRLDGSLF